MPLRCRACDHRLAPAWPLRSPQHLVAGCRSRFHTASVFISHPGSADLASLVASTPIVKPDSLSIQDLQRI